MGGSATKSSIKKQLSKYHLVDADYFEVYPAPDCCPKCEAKANQKIAIATATKDDFPPFHGKCRCGVLPLGEKDKPGALAKQKARYASGEFPMKRCPHCKEWIAGNAIACNRCNKNI